MTRVVVALLILGVSFLGVFLLRDRWSLPYAPGRVALSAKPDAGRAERLDAGPPRIKEQPGIDKLAVGGWEMGEVLCPAGMFWATSQECRPGDARCLSSGVCVDAFAYPNQRYVRTPASMHTLPEAERTCELEGKRLCAQREWEAACDWVQAQCQLAGSLDVLDSESVGRDGVAAGPCEQSTDLLRIKREWTRSRRMPKYRAAIKGRVQGSEQGRPGALSCQATRQTILSEARAPDISFRCCADSLVEPALASE